MFCGGELMRKYLSVVLMAMVVWASPVKADYMATGFAVNTGAPLTNRFMGVLITPGAFLTAQLDATSVPFSVSTSLTLKSIDCILDPSTWVNGENIVLEVYTHTDSSGDSGTASGMTLTVTAVTADPVNIYHYSGSDVSVSETEGALSLKLVTNNWASGTIQMQCSIRYDGA
jgi:hypothetical protein